MEEIRLQKYLSDMGIMSRRAAEKEITDGKVKVNGITAELGMKIDPDKAVVTYKGKVITRNKTGKKVYLMLNKPRGYVSTASDEKGRKCVNELVADVGTRVYSMGRLDMYSEGLLLFTNDGELANKLTHPGHDFAKIYNVRVKGEITPEQLKKLRGKMTIDGYEIIPVKTEVLSRKEGTTLLQMELYEGRNRQIRKMCEICELEVVKLRRIAVGKITLGNLAPGKWRYLTKAQIEYLKKL